MTTPLFNRREIANELGIDVELIIGLNRYLTQGEDYEFGENTLNGVKNQFYYTQKGKEKIEYRLMELMSLRMKLKRISKNITGNNHFRCRKELDVSTRLGMLKYLGDKLSIYEICFLLEKDRSTVYHSFDTLNNHFLKETENKNIEIAYQQCIKNKLIG